MFPRAKAFTFIELLMVITMMGILSVILGLSYTKLQTLTRFKNEKTQIVNMIEKAHSLSLSSILINDTEPTDYYELSITPSTLSLDAYASDGTTTENIDSLSLERDFSFDLSVDIFYFPPYGDVCFDVSTCDSADTSKTREVTLSDSSTDTATFTIDVNGGYVNVD